jgi:hypothetical protein
MWSVYGTCVAKVGSCFLVSVDLKHIWHTKAFEEMSWQHQSVDFADSRTEVLLALWPVLWTALWCPGCADRRQGKLQGFFPTRSYVLTMDTQGLLTGCAPLLMISYHRIQYCQSYVPDIVPTSEIIIFCSTLQYGTPKWRLKKTMLNTKGCVWGLFNIRWNGIALIACNHHVKPVEHIPSMGERLQGGQHSQDGARHCSLANLIHEWFKRVQSFKPCWWRCMNLR